MPKNIELREKISGTFDNANSLLYAKTHISNIDGLFSPDGSIRPELLPQISVGGHYGLGSFTPTGAHNTLDMFSNAIKDKIAQIALDDTSVDRTALNATSDPTNWNIAKKVMIAMYIIMGADVTMTPSTNHSFDYGDDGGGGGTGAQSLNANDYVVINSVSGGTGADPISNATFTFGVINNKHGLASTTASGLMSSTDKTKLDLFTSPYVHPTQTAIDVDATDNGLNVIDRVVVNTLGHVTHVYTRNLSLGTTSAAGPLQLATLAEVRTATNQTKAITPEGAKESVNYHTGNILYANVGAADAANHPNGAIVYVTVS